MRIVVAITGASGVVYGIRLLESLQGSAHETHLILSPWGEKNIVLETQHTPEYVKSLAGSIYRYDNVGSSLASGSNKMDGMVIMPCSMKTLSALAHGYSDNLIVRAADVALKEKWPLIIVPRETPLNMIHLNNMLAVCTAGAQVLPPMPAFYHKPESLDDVISQTVGKVLDQLGIEHELYQRWSGV